MQKEQQNRSSTLSEPTVHFVFPSLSFTPRRTFQRTSSFRALHVAFRDLSFSSACLSSRAEVKVEWDGATCRSCTRPSSCFSLVR